MKIVKYSVITVVGMMAILLIVALFLPTHFSLERQALINKPVPVVFNYVRHLQNHARYTPWNALDPNRKTSYRGTDGAVGFVAAWESENRDVGKGEQEIKNIVEGQRIDIEIRFTEPFQPTDPAYLATEAVGPNQTKVTFGYHGKMQYPTNLMTAFIKQKIGADMATSLANLKGILEKESY
jgi:hypothetical protein